MMFPPVFSCQIFIYLTKNFNNPISSYYRLTAIFCQSNCPSLAIFTVFHTNLLYFYVFMHKIRQKRPFPNHYDFNRNGLFFCSGASPSDLYTITAYSYSTTSSHFSSSSFSSGIAFPSLEAAVIGIHLCTYCFAVSLISQNVSIYRSASF